MSIAFSIDLNSIYYLPDWVCHPTIIDRPFLFQREGAEKGRGEWGEVHFEKSKLKPENKLEVTNWAVWWGPSVNGWLGSLKDPVYK